MANEAQEVAGGMAVDAGGSISESTTCCCGSLQEYCIENPDDCTANTCCGSDCSDKPIEVKVTFSGLTNCGNIACNGGGEATDFNGTWILPIGHVAQCQWRLDLTNPTRYVDYRRVTGSSFCSPDIAIDVVAQFVLGSGSAFSTPVPGPCIPAGDCGWCNFPITIDNDNECLGSTRKCSGETGTATIDYV